ncbi:hypothetical protein [Streptomyces rubradiris]|uniref:hypothetical protein n=1 Tax=Streptomyces rubradiris TaxID=285531 RepID=UPI00167386DF|nr:hypothetical protein [Streptomyces rubradiris]
MIITLLIHGGAQDLPTEIPGDTSDAGLLSSTTHAVAELTNALCMSQGSVTLPRKVLRPLDTAVTIAITTVAAILIALKTTLDQLSGLLESAAQTRDAWRRFRDKETRTSQSNEQAPPTDQGEPPAAA